MNRIYLLSVTLMMFSGCAIVGPQEQGVRMVAGRASEVLEPGPHVWFPVLYGVKNLDVSIQKSEVETSAASKDLQEVRSKVAVNWSIHPEKVSLVYKTIGDERDALERIVIPAVNEILKAATAKRAAEQILTHRLELKAEIDKSLNDRLNNYGLKLSDVNIVDLHFSDQFTHAIEEKQISEQRSQQSKYLAEKAVNDAQAEVNRAKGQAEAQRLIKATITPEILKQKAIDKWDGKFPQVMSAGTLPFINLNMKD